MKKKTYKINFYLPNENIKQNILNEINSRFDDETHRKYKQKVIKKLLIRFNFILNLNFNS